MKHVNRLNGHNELLSFHDVKLEFPALLLVGKQIAENHSDFQSPFTGKVRWDFEVEVCQGNRVEYFFALEWKNYELHFLDDGKLTPAGIGHFLYLKNLVTGHQGSSLLSNSRHISATLRFISPLCHWPRSKRVLEMTTTNGSFISLKNFMPPVRTVSCRIMLENQLQNSLQ